MKYLENLNERQKEAVMHTAGPLLIVAGAGAGKTKTITHRIAHLIETGTPAHSVLAVTFTNKAAREMRERIHNLLGSRTGSPLVATFHALGVRLLREFHAEAGIERDFSIWDRDDSLRAVKKILRELSEDLKPSAVLSVISKEKGNGTPVQKYQQVASSRFERIVASVWEQYEKILSSENAFDFDDLLLRTLRLLTDRDEVRSLLRERWPHITIDEYQDTNRAQFEIARLLAGDRMNICVVGDTDQNIYSWRGADMRHLLSFEKTYPGAKVVFLEQNYRSTRTILTAANAVIEKNAFRAPKMLFTENPTGEPIALYGARTEADEAWFVTEAAGELIAQGTLPEEVAVLYRENFQSRVLEEAFLAAGIPHKVLGTRFFERKEVKDVLSYLRAALNPKSASDIVRIIATPSRGIGSVTLSKMLAGKEEGLPSATRAKIAEFRRILAAIGEAARTLPCSDAVRLAAALSGIEKMLTESSSGERSGGEGFERIENVRELVNLSTRFDHEEPPVGIEKLLEEAALMSEQDTLDESGGVALMTVHASKGLEFDAVFITGLEQGLFPESREDDRDRDPEEERRLFYVALTRARHRLFLSYAGSRQRWGERDFTVPSEFLEDIDPRLFSYAGREKNGGEAIIT